MFGKDLLLLLVLYFIAVMILWITFTFLWKKQRRPSSLASLNQEGTKYGRKTPPMGVAIAGAMIVYLVILGMRAQGVVI